MREERDRLAGELSAVIRTTDTYHEELLHVPGVAPLRDIAQDIRTESDEMLEDGRLLRLGIVGQIKAGKSTLLNLLLFGGNEVLPRAATPMTAALTHIVRSDEVGADHAEIDVDYYSTEEWREIEDHARACRKEVDAGRSPGEFLRACSELVAMAEQRRIRVTDHAGTETESVSIDRLNERPRSLVGADGELTPLVRSVTIRCGSGIPDLDVVDTPGLNDPISSRVRATRKLLGKCDAVLLLSYAGQFMDSSDLELLTHTLPAEGISERVLIASKFDSALIDVAPDHRGDLHAAAEDVERQLRDRIERMRDEDADVRVASERVLFTSALCAILGLKPCARWSAAERDGFAALHRRYPDWLAPPQNGAINDATKSNLTSLLGRKDDVDDAIQTIRARKDGIMERKIRDYLQAKEDAVGNHVDTVIADLEQKREEIRSGDLDTLEDRKKAVLRSIDEMGSAFFEEWSGLIASQTERLGTARRRCHEAVDEGRRAVPDSIEVKQMSRTIRKKRGFLGLAWLFRSIVGVSHDEHETYERKIMNETSLRAKLEQARDNVRSHVDRELDKMFGIDFAADAGKKLRTVCAGAMDNTTASEAKPSFARSLDRAVEQISEQARRSLRGSRASAELDVLSVDLSGDMPQKESAAFDYANVLHRAFDSIFDAAVATADDVNKKAIAELLPLASRDLEKYHERLQQEIKDRAFTLQRWSKVAFVDTPGHTNSGRNDGVSQDEHVAEREALASRFLLAVLDCERGGLSQQDIDFISRFAQKMPAESHDQPGSDRTRQDSASIYVVLNKADKKKADRSSILKSVAETVERRKLPCFGVGLYSAHSGEWFDHVDGTFDAFLQMIDGNPIRMSLDAVVESVFNGYAKFHDDERTRCREFHGLLKRLQIERNDREGLAAGRTLGSDLQRHLDRVEQEIDRHAKPCKTPTV